VQAVIIYNESIGRDITEVLRVLDAVIFTQEHGQVCPANWAKGQEGITATQNGLKEYLNKNKESLSNAGDLTVPAGTKINWNFTGSGTDAIEFAFENEKISGNKLSFRTIASIKDSEIPNIIYNILTTSFDNISTNCLDNINEKILKINGITIYPSYYFNPYLNNIPDALIKSCIYIQLWK
jgi:hypothetical protein